MKRLMLLAIIALLSFTALVTGCSSAPGSTEGETDKTENGNVESQQEKVLLLNNGGEPTSLDPPIGNDGPSYEIVNNIMEGLTRLSKDRPVPEPAMAKEWKVSEDGLTYTFFIREDANWTNGEPVTAHDFVYSWKRLADPKTASPAAHHSYWIAGAEEFNKGEGSIDDVKVRATDDKTLEVTLKYPVDIFLSVVAMPQLFPVHKETVEYNPDWAGSVETLVTNGPFKVTEWRHDEMIKLEKNEKYWDVDTVNLDAVEYAMVDDSNTAYQLYEAEELHLTAIPSDLKDQLIDSPETKVYPRSGIEFQRFNVNVEPFQNANIRKAFSTAIDREKIVEFITKGKEKTAYYFTHYAFEHPSGGNWEESVGKLVEYNPEEAKKLLAKGMEEEGYTTLPEVTLSYNTSDQHRMIAQAIQEMLKQNLGIDIKLFNQEWAVFLAAQRNNELQYSRSSFIAGYNDPINYLSNFTTGNPMNRTGWSNDKYDKIIEQSYLEKDPVKRFEILEEAEQLLMEEAIVAPLYFYNTTLLQKPEVEGIVRHPVGFTELKWADIK
jgi:dipeptide transport system substrate-binding protein